MVTVPTLGGFFCCSWWIRGPKELKQLVPNSLSSKAYAPYTIQRINMHTEQEPGDCRTFFWWNSSSSALTPNSTVWGDRNSTPQKTNMTTEKSNHLKMFFPSEMVTFQLVMLVIRGVRELASTFQVRILRVSTCQALQSKQKHGSLHRNLLRTFKHYMLQNIFNLSL